MSDPIKLNEAYVLNHHDELARRAEERGMTTVLVFEQEAVDFFPSEIDAVKDGYRRFGAKPFYVRVVAGADVLRVVASNFTR